ncbi:40S ribosomal protein S4 [Diplogelasinospora grovesii]|uniref:40S ribosomal protein S4 n=1 Tax=Diplogelasinospora grovesii TaxID=303347 RepID=A0AAN6S7P6_9PEZI|nr:40S ribosomal protein S4 [Diplogelasinospora grovesii]
MATIEPRLIHLLNNSQTPDLAPIQLPPLDPRADHSLSLPPLESDAGQRIKQAPAPTAIPPLHALGDGPSPNQTALTGDRDANGSSSRPNASARALQFLHGDAKPTSSYLPLRMILDDTPDANKKIHRGLTLKDHFVQLPLPPKKQKSMKHVVPPIINGLHEPPPDAAVFPPIASSPFEDSDGLNLSIFKDPTNSDDRAGPTALASDADKMGGPKSKRKLAKPRKKWSEEETNHLLLGVSRHGVGKWTSILDDPDFRFNERTAGDLKDRFRTCCPEELRGKAAGKKKRSAKDRAADAAAAAVAAATATATSAPAPAPAASGAGAGPNAQRESKDVPLPHRAPMASEGPVKRDKDSSSAPHEPDSSPKRRRKTRLHRRKMEDLADLGIQGPFKKSHRRERRPFTEQDDKEILEGLDEYGPHWTKIQRDMRYNLSSRQPTDLRDRVRNKYPEIYARIEKGNCQASPPGSGWGSNNSNLLEPSVNTTIENSLHSTLSGPLEHQLNRTSSKEDILPNKKHQKRLSAPSHWLLDKLSGVYAPRASSGPHKLRECMPLIIFVRNRLKYALNYRETKAIMMQRLVKVDGKVRTDITYPAGFMDVITIEKTGENFRLIYDVKGRFTVHRIQEEEAKYKLGKVKRVQLGRGGIPFLVTHDARTIRYPDPLVKVNDTVKIDLETGKIQDFIKFDTGAIAMVTGGRNIGRVGVITHRERHDGGFNIVHLKDAIDNTFATRESNVFVIGQEKPWVSLPKGKGVKLTIAEERDRRRAHAMAGH